MVRDLRATLPELAKTDAEIAEAVNRGVNLLMSMQTSAGGLSFWPGGREPTLWGSAYGGLALALAQKQKFLRSGSGDEKTVRLSERTTSRHGEGRNRLRTFRSVSRGLHAGDGGQAGAGLSRSAFSKTRETERGRSSPGRARGDRKQRSESDDRRTAARPTSSDAYIDQFFGSVARENALHLLAWTLHEPRSPRVDRTGGRTFPATKQRPLEHDAGERLVVARALLLPAQGRNGRKNATGQISWDKATRLSR